MGGGLMQLVAYGAQDIYLTGNPQITFFKVVYRRHTNFSMETIQQTVNGAPSDGGSSTVTISRNGDLVSKIYITNASTGITQGSALVDQVELEIGGQRIDRQYREWMNIWTELSTPGSKASGFKTMVGDEGSTGSNSGVNNVFLPLHFWFCRNPGLALPLIALQYHEVKLKITWGTSGTGDSQYGGSANDVSVSKIWCDYIYLDTDERRRFAQVSHEYLIEQLQRETPTGSAGDTKLNFNHPVKELIWTSDSDYTDSKLVLNGHDRFSAQTPEYFQLRQPYDYHTAIPRQNDHAGNILGSTINTRYSNFSSFGGIHFTDTPVTADTVSNTFTIEQPGNSLLIDVGLICKESFTTGAGDTSFDVGTSALGTQICDGANAVNNDASAIVQGTKVSASTSGLMNAGATTLSFADAAVLANIGPATRTIYGTITKAGAVTAAGSAQMFISYKKTKHHNSAATSNMVNRINVYSFALKPEEHQPSGTCNFSRIDNAKLNFTASPHSGTMSIYAVNYNVLRIMSGMGGLAYSN
jgi:hypothetical protein